MDFQRSVILLDVIFRPSLMVHWKKGSCTLFQHVEYTLSAYVFVNHHHLAYAHLAQADIEDPCSPLCGSTAMSCCRSSTSLSTMLSWRPVCVETRLSQSVNSEPYTTTSAGWILRLIPARSRTSFRWGPHGWPAHPLSAGELPRNLEVQSEGSSRRE